MAEMKQKKPHAIMISVPYQGHINPFVNLALKLASKGFSITFAHLEFVHHKLSKTHHHNTTEFNLFSEAQKSGLDIRYTTISDGFPLEFDRDLQSQKYWSSLFHDFPALVDEFVGKVIQLSNPYLLHFLIADTVYAWPATIAQKHNLVNVSFWTEPALVFTLGYHWGLLKEKGHSPFNDNSQEVEINYIPGIQSIRTRDLMSFVTEDEGILTGALFSAFEEVKKADFILHNTVHELEYDTISALNKYQPNYAVGPINFSKNLHANSISKSLLSETDCTQWLASKNPGSVLYVSFGSLVHTSKELIEEIAYGLLLSGVNFVWVVRAGIVKSGGDDILPDGYEDKIRDNGLIISWCDQIKVLSNPAVGGFLTHNGWNSTVESMWCGVPMICCPIMWDQLTNRKLVVDEWKIGISLCDGKSIDRKEVAETIKRFMSGETWKNLRQEAEKVRETLHKALEVEGSSERNFDQFVKDLKKKIYACD